MENRPLRRDAERNRERLIAAGRELFAQRGADATLNDVAAHAGVGVGTAYRRFPNKQALFDAIFEQQIADLEAVLREAIANPDAWAGLVGYLERSLEVQARDRGMAQILSGRRVRPEQHDWERDRLAPLINALVESAKSQGAVRPDVVGTDLVFAQIGLIAIAEAAHRGSEGHSRSDLHAFHRRYLVLLLDGIRAHPHPSSTLPVPPLSTEETHRLLS